MLDRLKLALGGDHFLPQSIAGPSEDLLVTCDTMVPGVHYFADVDAVWVGRKLAAVNLSDIAAMGGTPKAALLQVSGVDPAAPQGALWLDEFARGLFEWLDSHDVSLLGTSVSRGAPVHTLQLIGSVSRGDSLRRDLAQVGDRIFVSGTIGDAALALALELRPDTAGLESLISARLHHPSPRVKLGRSLLGIATAAIDISDGLAGDLGHITNRSAVGAILRTDSLPRSVAFNTLIGVRDPVHLCLTGGDDYELCFTAPASAAARLSAISEELDIPITEVGEITQERGIILEYANGTRTPLESTGYQHFRANADLE